MGLTKWLFSVVGFAALGWTGAGPIGALLGYLIGRGLEERRSESSHRDDSFGKYHRGPYRNQGTQNDINIALIVLIAAVMKADGDVKRSELNYVKIFLLNNYGEEEGKEYLSMIRELVKPETPIDLDGICYQIKQNTDYTTRYHMVDFLFGLAISDSSYDEAENVTLRSIARKLGINPSDYMSIYTRHVGNRQQQSSYSNYNQYGRSEHNGPSSRQSSRNKDPYKVLGLTASATDTEIKKAYRRLAMKYHPDKVESMGEEMKKNAESQFREINEAYETIKAARGMK